MGRVTSQRDTTPTYGWSTSTGTARSNDAICSTGMHSVRMRARRFAGGRSGRWFAAPNTPAGALSGQPRARSRDLARDLILVTGEQPASAYDSPAVDDHGLSTRRRRERQARHQVLYPRV